MIIAEMPRAFKKACRNLGQGLDTATDVIDPSAPIPGMVAVALIGIDEQDAAEIVPYVNELLEGGYTSEEFRQFWWTAPAHTYFRDGSDVVTFLRLLLSKLSVPPYVLDAQRPVQGE